MFKKQEQKPPVAKKLEELINSVWHNTVKMNTLLGIPYAIYIVEDLICPIHDNYEAIYSAIKAQVTNSWETRNGLRQPRNYTNGLHVPLNGWINIKTQEDIAAMSIISFLRINVALDPYIWNEFTKNAEGIDIDKNLLQMVYSGDDIPSKYNKEFLKLLCKSKCFTKAELKEIYTNFPYEQSDELLRNFKLFNLIYSYIGPQSTSPVFEQNFIDEEDG